MTTSASIPASPNFQTAKLASIRLWHWLTFLFFTASITTVIFGSTLFKTDDNISMVQQQVQAKGGVVTKDQAWKVAHEYRLVMGNNILLKINLCVQNFIYVVSFQF